MKIKWIPNNGYKSTFGRFYIQRNGPGDWTLFDLFRRPGHRLVKSAVNRRLRWCKSEAELIAARPIKY